MNMEVNEDSKSSTKNSKPRWNIFQRGAKNKSSSALNTLSDPSELQRVSFATSINDLPERPSAFKQVLGQIGAFQGVQKMKRVQSFKKLTKDVRSNSPQGRLSIGSAGPTNLDVSYTTRPRSSSNSSFHGLHSDGKSLFADDCAAGSNENRSSTPAGTLLLEPMVQPVTAPTFMSGIENGSANHSVASYDVVDGSPASEHQRNRTSVELDHLQQKILKISEALKLEQATKDENVADYLKLANNADKQQAGRIKTVFEKKNQKSNATISQLQKKLETYHRRLRELQENGGGRQGRNPLRDVGANLREISGGMVGSVKQATQNAAGAFVAKPKDFASRLKNRFGSADNLHSLPDDDVDDYATRSGSADDVSYTSELLEFAGPSVGPEEAGRRSLQSGPDSPTNVNHIKSSLHLDNLTNQLLNLQSEIEEIQRSRSQLESDFTMFKSQAHDDVNFLTEALREERRRFEVQFNDLTELHQHEISSLKQELTSMEDKVEYHARERERDMQETIENCQTRLARMELQQQQMVAVEGLENANARALLGKSINLLLSVLAVVLVFVSTISGLITPLMRSPTRIFSTLVVVFVAIVTYKNYDKFVFWYMGGQR